MWDDERVDGMCDVCFVCGIVTLCESTVLFLSRSCVDGVAVVDALVVVVLYVVVCVGVDIGVMMLLETVA